MKTPWAPSNPGRFAELGLADPDPQGGFPKNGTTADVLAYGLMLPGATDPIDGIVDGVRLELDALASVLSDRRMADVLMLLSRRLEAAMVLLRRADNRERNILEQEEEEGEEEGRDTMLPQDPGEQP